MRVLPDAGRQDKHRGDGQRPARRNGRGREASRLPFHGQGGLSDQRHGHLQGDDGACHRRERPRGGGAQRDGHLLHAVRERHVLARQRDPAVHRPDQDGQPDHDHEPRHDAVPHESRRGGGSCAVRVRACESGRPVHPEGGRVNDRRSGEGRPEAVRRHGNEYHRNTSRREALRDADDAGGAAAVGGHGALFPRVGGQPRPELRQVFRERAGADGGRRGLHVPQHDAAGRGGSRQ